MLKRVRVWLRKAGWWAEISACGVKFRRGHLTIV